MASAARAARRGFAGRAGRGTTFGGRAAGSGAVAAAEFFRVEIGPSIASSSSSRRAAAAAGVEAPPLPGPLAVSVEPPTRSLPPDADRLNTACPGPKRMRDRGA